MDSRCFFATAAWLALACAHAGAAKPPPAAAIVPAEPSEVFLDELDLAAVQQGMGRAKKNRSVEGGPISLGGKVFERGIGTHARSEMRILLDGKALRLIGLCGLDDASAKDTAASVDFEIVADGAVVWRSGVLKAGSPAVAYDVPLEGVKELRLKAGDAGDGMASDRADWADAAIRFTGQPPKAVGLEDDDLAARLPPVKEAPGGPPDAPAEVKWEAAGGNLQLLYGKRLLLRATLANGAVVESRSRRGLAVEQRISLSRSGEPMTLIVHGGRRALAAETRGEAQQRFPLVRTSSGPGRNLRNHAVYDPDGDWMLEFPAGATRITSFLAADRTMRFEVRLAAREAELVFRPRYFQKHRNLPYYQPWANAFRDGAPVVWELGALDAGKTAQAELKQALQVWKARRLEDFGCGELSMDFSAPVKPAGEGKEKASGKTSHVSAVGKVFADAVKKAGAAPALAVEADAAAGSAALNPAFYRDWRKAGVSRFRIDRLERPLFDRLHANLAERVARKERPDEVLRASLAAVRKEAGKDSFLTVGRGVLPEAIGLADACRLGGDGYVPAALQQYNSWNGIVWRNDPGPCDVVPGGVPADKGDGQPVPAPDFSASVLRPALASIAGAVLNLGDKAAVYQDDRGFAGLCRVLPVVPSLPGQLYDYDDAKSSWFATGERTGLRSSADPAPTDPDPAVAICPWWLNEFDTAAGHWNVLHRVNAGAAPLPVATVRLGDLGIDPAKRYFVHEFWSGTFLGLCRDSFDIPALPAKGVQSYAIREAFDRPQIVSTSRHFSQGAVDLLEETWDESASTLTGKSRLVAGDRYTLTIAVPEGYQPSDAIAGERMAAMENLGRIVKVTFQTSVSGVVEWSVGFVR